ncbi:MAG TPA: disulfide bond formation protein B [Hellea balneolensis]|uniref:Disulfide bond formation protein B n=1 Tax=Hellea balneolensis TaxID=287478 RepID=A0A7C3GKJ8_9PROT|nr:disulfide bond formation protein B [Hellea balneolensis]
MIFAHINTRIWPWLAFLLSASLWIGALGFEHIGGYAPCQMCYWQRHAHKAVLVISAVAILFQLMAPNNPKRERLFVLLIGCAFLVSFGLAFWHTGVEYKWWEGPKTCSVGANMDAFNANDILGALKGKVKMPACSDAPWHLFGISMAGYNALISAGAAIMSFIVASKGSKA